MFGFVTVNTEDLTADQKTRYTAVYCGICREIGRRMGSLPRLTLSYDLAFLSLLLMSLYEPEEKSGTGRCLPHPVRRRSWVGNDAISYGADMNVALAYYKSLDDWSDDKSISKKLLAQALKPHYEEICVRYPRQCRAMEVCLRELGELERAGERNPDRPAGCFGRLMEELMVWKEDLWEPSLRTLGNALGRFIYLADAICDYEEDKKAGKYNPLPAAPEAREAWRELLVLTMARCTAAFERLPLVQDKGILDVILYSGVWMKIPGNGETNDTKPL